MALSAYMWPNPSDPTFTSPLTRFTPTLDVTAPPTPACSSSPTGSSWGSAGAPNELVPVPADMTTTDLASNRKWQVISQYASQIACTVNADGTYPASCGYLRAFVKAKEFFWTEQITAPQLPVSSGLPVVSGSVVVGQVLSGSTGTWTGSPTSFAYEWRRCDATGAGCAAVAGATAASYTLVPADAGHTLRIAVTASNTAGSATAVSAATAVVSAGGTEGSFGQAQVGTLVDGGGAGYLDLSGPYALGSTVSVTRLSGYMAGGSAVSRMRGLIYTNNGGQPGTLVAVSSEISIAAAAAATWVSLPFTSPVTLPAGSYWLGYWYADGNGRRYYTDTTGAERYKPATYSATANPPTTFGTASTSTSNYSLIAVYDTGQPPEPPVSSGLPVVSGSVVVGQVLSGSTGTWTGSPTSFAYEWRRCDATGAGCAAIAGATTASYTLAAADVGHTLRLAVTASNSAGSATAVSTQTAVVVAAAQPPVNTGLPVISGSAVDGQLLSASTGTWTGAPTSYTYEWRRCNAAGAACTAILGAIGAGYTLALADLGSTIRVAVTATNSAGSATAVSAQTAVVVQAPPVSSGLPVVSGRWWWGRCCRDRRGPGRSPTRSRTSGGAAMRPVRAVRPSRARRRRATRWCRQYAGHTLRIAVTASNTAGSATAVSAATAVVSAGGTEGSFGQAQVGTLVDGGGAGDLDLSGPYALGSTVSVTRLSGYMAGGSAVLADARPDLHQQRRPAGHAGSSQLGDQHRRSSSRHLGQPAVHLTGHAAGRLVLARLLVRRRQRPPLLHRHNRSGAVQAGNLLGNRKPTHHLRHRLHLHQQLLTHRRISDALTCGGIARRSV